MSTLAVSIFFVAGSWYVALILNLRHVAELPGVRFFWTALLGLGPFTCLGLIALLGDRYIRSNRSHNQLMWAAVAAGVSPWLLWPLVFWFGTN